MEFAVEFYETDAGKRPVQEFPLKLKAHRPRRLRRGGRGVGEAALPPVSP